MWYYKESLKECPFCQNEELKCELQNGDFYIGYIAYVRCENCLATHGWCWGETPEEACHRAAEKWNTRTKIL